MTHQIEILGISICPAHHFKGHERGAPGEVANREVERVQCVAGRGLTGDRYFDYREDFKGQITFFDHAVYEELLAFADAASVEPFPWQTMRRNVLVRGVDLNTLVGREFRIGDVSFAGSEECKPCFWMNDVCAPGAEDWLRGRGGLRARILRDGWLDRGPTELDA